MLAAYFLTAATVFAAGVYLGRDAERTRTRERDARRRAHRHQIAANRPRTTTRKETH